ncbi:MAG: TonB family protein [Porphyrobacter sp.]|nr:TonB family protein [Porphyrobacter sp.]
MNQWASALSPHEPPVPRRWHWGAGLAASAALLGVLAIVAARQATTEESAASDQAPVLVSLGGGAQRLEPPPPAPPDALAQADEGPVAERAPDAPPIAAPPLPRAAPNWTQGTGGQFSSGTGAGPPRPAAPAPPPSSPPPPPPPPPPPRISQRYTQFSNALYASKVQYPAEALRREEQGTGLIRIVVARDGRVLRWHFAQSTGHRLLDREIERVANEVKHVEPLPGDYPADTAEVTIRFAFVLEYIDEP